MNDEKLVQLHEILKEPLRQKILLQLGEHGHLTFDDLMTNLKIDDAQELTYQLNTLEKLTIDEEHLISEQADSQFSLTDKGHFVLDEMIAFPELELDSYRQKFGKSGVKLGKEIYVIVGASLLGFAFWAIIMLISNASGFRWGMTDLTADYFAGITLILSWITGGFIGYFIGKKTNYKFPMMQRT